MAYYRVDMIVKSDRDEDELAMFIEGLVMQARHWFKLDDIAVWEINR